MVKQRWLKLILLVFLVGMTAVACRNRDEEPTPTSGPVSDQADGATSEPDDAPDGDVDVAEPPAYDWPPQLVYSSPEPGEEALLDGAITVRFDQPMDQKSVEAAFQINRPGLVDGVGGVFSWPRPDTVVFTPQSGLEREQTYEVTISESAAGQNGRPLRETISLRLQTVGFLEVSQVIPAPGSDEIQTDGAITVLFNRPVVPLTGSGQQAGLPQPLILEPAVSGQGEWVSTSIYRFVPDEPLAGSTRYEARVAAGLSDTTGGLLAADFSWSFTTLSPTIVAIEPADLAENVRPTDPITVTFNMPMDQEVTEAAISLSETAELDYEWSQDGRFVTIRPAQPLELAGLYRLTVAASAQSANGGAALERAETSTFSTVAFPAILGSRPEDGAQAERYQRGIQIRFASPMDLATLEDQLRIRPEPEQVNYYFDTYNFFLSVDFELERNTEYLVTVPGSAADPYGNTLGEDVTFRFTTPGFAPLVSLNLPGQPYPISQLSRSYPSNVEVIYRNVSGFEAHLYNLGELGYTQLQFPNFYDYVPVVEPQQSWLHLSEAAQDEAAVFSLPLGNGQELSTGIYYLEVGADEIGPEQYWQNQKNLIVVADTNLVVKEMFDAVHVWATDLAGGFPVSGRELTLYSSNGEPVGTAVTDGRGFARFDYTQPDGYFQGVLVVSGRPGSLGFGAAASTWDTEVTPWDFGLTAASADEPERFAYLYTDRPIYRPGDTVFFRGIVRQSNYGRYTLPGDPVITLGLDFTSNYETLNFEFQSSLDENGQFSGQYTIPEEAELGNYRLYFQNEDIQAARSFTVAQYRKPEFQVQVTTDEAALLRGASTEVVIEAGYFFGGPATDLVVNWSVYEQPYRLSWEGPNYSFGDDAGFFYEPAGPFDFGGGGGAFGNYLLGGEGRTDGSGRLVIELPADLLAEVEAGSRQVTVEASVLDLGALPVSARTDVVFHEADGYVGIRSENYLGVAGTSTAFELITVDWAGQPLAGRDVQVIFYRREWQSSREEEFDFYYTRWEAIDSEVERLSLTTDSQGRAEAAFEPPEGGHYLAVATVFAGAGRRQTSSTAVWVTGGDFVGWRTDSRERRMELTVDKQSYHVGDTAQILVQSPFSGPVQAWLTIERGNLLEQQVVTLNGNSDTLEIPITADFAPNVHLSLAAVKGIGGSSRYADIRLGIVELVVDPEQLTLDVNLTPQRESFEPGETAVYDILVTDYEGNPVSADLSLALVDLAVLSLKPDNAPDIADAFYARQPYRSRIGSGLFVSGEGLEVEIPLEQLGRGGGGGGEADSVSTFGLDDQEEEVRRDFPDTAFWEAVISTGEDGQATIEIPLPDNLTTWRLSSKAVSSFAAAGETLVGQSQVDVVVNLPLLVRPQTPRFFTVGDQVQLGATVHNNTAAELEVTVSLEADGVSLRGPAEQLVTIDAGQRRLVQWPVVVEDVAFADLTFRAEAGVFRDATRPTFGLAPDQLLPVYRFTGEDIVGTSGILEETGRRVEAVLLPPNSDEQQGGVYLELTPSLAAAMLSALDYVNTLADRSTCAHAVADQLLPNLAALRIIRQLSLGDGAQIAELDQAIRLDVNRLPALQKMDGGWGWCYGAESEPYLTAYVLLALAKAGESGYVVDSPVVSSGASYLDRQLQPAGSLNDAAEVNRQAFFLYVLAELGRVDGAELDALFTEQRALLDPYARALLLLAYERTGDGRGNSQDLVADLNDSVLLSAAGAHWQDASPDWQNLSSDIRGTAMVIAALVRLDPGNVLLPNAVRWLTVARTAGHWPSGQDNAWAIIALGEWLVQSDELDVDYSYQVTVNGQRAGDGLFGPNDITTTDSWFVPVSDLNPDQVNFFDFQRGEGSGRLYYTAYLDTFVSAENLMAVDRGIFVRRTYYDAACDSERENCLPITEIEAGQQIRVELTLIAPHDLLYVTLEDHLPAGAEAIDPGLSTSAEDSGAEVSRTDRAYLSGYWGWWFFNRIEFRDDRVVFLSDFLPAGTYQYSYLLQTTLPGLYQVSPAVARQEFFPDVFGRSEGLLLEIEP